MKLTLKQIQSITLGSVLTEEENGAFRFHRFTKEQEDHYEKKNVVRRKASSGIKLSFITDSEMLFLKVSVEQATGRSFFALDVLVDGKYFDNLANFEETSIPRRYSDENFPMGEYEKEFRLPEGEKEIVIHFPWSVFTVLQEISLSDGASLVPKRPKKKLLCFGDSITQGYDALHPSRKYTAQLADALGMEEFNKGIGGEKFQPWLAECKEAFVPDLITVAYGTNDWSKRTREEFEENCRGFFKNLVKNYPHTPILVISPLWRRIWQREKPCGPYRSVDAFLKTETRRYENVTVMDGFGVLPQSLDYFGDFTVHPNDVGFDRYAERIVQFLKDRALLF